MSRFEFFNPNPKIRRRADGTPFKWHRGDCSVRAICKALDLSWEDAYKKLTDEGLRQYREMNSSEVITKVLADGGYEKIRLPTPPEGGRPTFDWLAANSDNDKKMVVFTAGHVATIADGKLHDTASGSRWCRATMVWKQK